MNDEHSVYTGRYKEFIESKLEERPDNIRFKNSECHHIIPECLGGTWSDGYVYLTYREHFNAHSILVEENPHLYKLSHALWRMANGKYGCTAEEYEFSRLHHVESLRDSMKGERNPNYNTVVMNNGVDQIHSKPDDVDYNISIGYAIGALPRSDEYRNNIRTALTGTKFTEERKRNLSISQKKYLETHPHQHLGKHHSEETKKKLSDLFRGRTVSEEVREKMRNSHIGHRHTEESKKLMSISKIGNPSNTGRVCINDGFRNKFVLREDVDKFITSGYHLGRLKKHTTSREVVCYE